MREEQTEEEQTEFENRREAQEQEIENLLKVILSPLLLLENRSPSLQSKSKDTSLYESTLLKRTMGNNKIPPKNKDISQINHDRYLDRYVHLLIMLPLPFVAILWWKIKRYLKSKNHDDMVGAGRNGFKNHDRVSCYANSAVQCLFSIEDNLFNVLPHLRGPVSKEIERLAFSSIGKTESTKQLRKLLPSGFGFEESVCQCICEFWDTLLNCIDDQNVPICGNPLSYQSPLSKIFHFENRKYLVCDICQWSEIEDHQISGKIFYLAIPTLGKCDIPFNGVLNPSPVGRYCPNGHGLTSHTIFTKTSTFLALSLNRNGSGSKNKAKIINIDLDKINLEAEEESSVIDSCYHDLLLSCENTSKMQFLVEKFILF
jgi:predicted nucleic-acid-binding Zn-ribbon protein